MKQSIEILNAIPKADSDRIQSAYEQALNHFHHKVIVLDDDPTGIQTVHGVSVFTDWSEKSIEAGFLEDSRMFFILTNSRSMTEKETAVLHETIASTIVKTAERLDQDFIIVSRGIPPCVDISHWRLKFSERPLNSKAPANLTAKFFFPFLKKAAALRLAIFTTYRKVTN